MSADIFKPAECRVGQRVILKASGYHDDDLTRPLIGIVNTYNEAHPGHCNYKELVEQIKNGIYRAGGTASEFGTISICDGMGGFHIGENYILPSREIIADSIETVAYAEHLDGLVLMASCDKIVPGVLMAAARLDIPCIVECGGPMLNGAVFNGRKSDNTSYPEAMGLMIDGKMTQQQVDLITDIICPTCGSCSFLGTANSMCCFAETLGMTLPGSSMIPAVYNDRKRDAFATGEAIVEMVRKGLTARKIITLESIKNSIAFAEATGASTNVVIHALAIAHEIGIEPEVVLPLFNEYMRKTPLVAQLNPNADHGMEEFYRAGGVPRVMQYIAPLLNLDVMTCTGKTYAENLKEYQYKYPEDREVLRPMDEAFQPTGGLAVLRGNVCPDTGVSKPSGIKKENRVFTGPAHCFNSEGECEAAIINKQIKPGEVIVIRYEGPKGGPGAREMCVALKKLKGYGLLDHIAMITDGRFSGTNNGCFVGQISPEAAAGGPIAILRDGDMITIDTVDKLTVSVDLTDEEIASRLKEWHYEPKPLHGYIAKYASMVQSFNTGAVMKY